MSVDQVNDFMALEPHIVALVQKAVQGMKPAVHVLTAADLADVKESAQKAPAIHVIYGGYVVTEDLRVTWRLRHKWYVVAAVRNVAKQRTGEAARAEAGSLGAGVAAALAGASLPGAATGLSLVTPPAARYSAGFQYIPSAFEVETIFKKQS
ncbi:MAG: hypothetical protein RSD57_14535 [Comamonas sp.]